MTANSRSNWSGNLPRRPRSSSALSARAGGDPRKTAKPRSRSRSNWSRSNYKSRLLQLPRLAVSPMETTATTASTAAATTTTIPHNSSRSPPTVMRSGSSRSRQLKSSPAMLHWEVIYSFAIMTPCRRILNASSLDYHNVTGTPCARFNQGFRFFCTIILLTSSMGSLRLRVLEVQI